VKNLFCFTGVDGCGKTTLINNVAAELGEKTGRKVVVSKAYSNEYKNLFGRYLEDADDIEVLFLLQALKRRQYTVAKEAARQGKIVLADKWDESYFAWHAGKGFLAGDEHTRDAINLATFGGDTPQITFFIKISPEIAKNRALLRGADRFDNSSLSRYQMLASHYEAQASANPSWQALDGSLQPRALSEAATSAVIKALA
jgi:thymidylate kinase